ncbi:MAG: biopolymer transporter ExbD [Planctomycetes bacterium]|nr:biopolymer transporter ExbD [Planctomycetota bacterium]
MRIRHHARDEKIELQMTPMIDIVFLLNIFFLFTFKIVLPEGDFNIRMPSAAAARAVEPSESLPLTLAMKAGPNGELADLQLAGRSFGNSRDTFARLHQHIRSLVDDSGGPGTANDQEIELDCDYDLHYDYVVRAITAITGYIENGQPHRLIDRIKFTPPERR